MVACVSMLVFNYGYPVRALTSDIVMNDLGFLESTLIYQYINAKTMAILSSYHIIFHFYSSIAGHGFSQ